MNLSAWALKRPILVILGCLFTLLAGVRAWHHLGVSDMPEMNFLSVTVSVGRPGASPTELETSVVRQLEDALASLPHVRGIKANIQPSRAVVNLRFAPEVHPDQALANVREAVQHARSELPNDIDEPEISQPQVSEDPFAVYAVLSDRRDSLALSTLIDTTILRRVRKASGVSQVSRIGGTYREIQIIAEPARLQGLGLDVDMLASRMAALSVDLPSGSTEIGDRTQAIRTLGAPMAVMDLAALPIPTVDQAWLRLGALATVSDTMARPTQSAWLDGRATVGFDVPRAPGTALINVAAATDRAVASLRGQLPPDVTIRRVFTSAPHASAAYEAATDSLVLGSLLAIGVIYLFLRNLRATLISAVAIPLSILATLALLYSLGEVLHQMNLLGLTLVVGVLVDDAIVEIENIERFLQAGYAPAEAALVAATEIGVVVIATTLTIVAVFVPVTTMMPGLSGQFFHSFGITVAAAVLFSLLVARAVIPTMAAKWLHSRGPAVVVGPWWSRHYQRWLAASLRHRWVVLGLAAAAFAATLSLVPGLPQTFLDERDSRQVSMSVAVPAGARLVDTEQVVRAATAVLRRQADVASVFAQVGTSVPRRPNEGKLMLQLVEPGKRTLSNAALEVQARADLAAVPGARFTISHSVTGYPKPVNLQLKGGDSAALVTWANRLQGEMARLPVLQDVTSSLAETSPELVIRPMKDRAADRGITTQTIARTALLATDGVSERQLLKLTFGDQQVPVRVCLPDWIRGDVLAIAHLPVRGRAGFVPLGDVARIGMDAGPSQIRRNDRQRQVLLSASLPPGVDLGQALAAVEGLEGISLLPDAIDWGFLGDGEAMGEVFEAFGIILPVSLLLIYGVLVALYRGFLQPLTIMLTLPLSAVGAVIALLVTGQAMGVVALAGFLLLMGLSTKNSILLVDFALQSQREGLSRDAAIAHACTQRLRPILMTSIAMLTGMVPIAIGFGEGTATLQPMAIVIVGGLITSTLFTLVVVPAAFCAFDDVYTRYRRRVSPGT
ncbi:MAG: efflux RND transporter permease subunit [Candidatus Sericytochromatia bacterium]|nr:efflux RND transporter permease subunit [Candidatus Sericytochromatia bacterium]